MVSPSLAEVERPARMRCCLVTHRFEKYHTATWSVEATTGPAFCRPFIAPIAIIKEPRTAGAAIASTDANSHRLTVKGRDGGACDRRNVCGCSARRQQTSPVSFPCTPAALVQHILAPSLRRAPSQPRVYLHGRTWISRSECTNDLGSCWVRQHRRIYYFYSRISVS